MRYLVFGITLVIAGLLVPVSSQADDQQIAQQIMQKLEQQKQAGKLKGFGINMQVENGIVRLKGNVSDRSQQYLVLDVARRIHGVRQVVNDIDISPPSVAKRVEPKDTKSKSLIAGVNSALKGVFSPGLPSKSSNEVASKPPATDVTANQPAAPPKSLPVPYRPDTSSRRIAQSSTTSASTSRQLAMAVPPPSRVAAQQRAMTKAPSLSSIAANATSRASTKPMATRPPTSTQVAPPVPTTLPVAPQQMQRKPNVPTTSLTSHAVSQPSMSRQPVQPRPTGTSVLPKGNRQPATTEQMRLAASADHGKAPAATPASGAAAPMQAPMILVTPESQRGASAMQANQPVVPGMQVVAGSPMAFVGQAPLQLVPVQHPGNNMPLAFAPAQGASFSHVTQPVSSQMMPVTPIPANLPGGGGGAVPIQHDQPQMPAYSWPSYASHPNYGAVNYPRQYSPTAWPYIGPFYPYPQVPLGWRKVSLKWKDGWWMLDFRDRH